MKKLIILFALTLAVGLSINSTTVMRIAQISGLQSALNGKVPTSTQVNGHSLSTDVSVTPGDLNLTIGTNTQAYDADLTTYAGITPSANVQTLLGSADYAAFRASLGLTVGTNVQAYDADLTTYAGITPSSNVQSYLGAADYAAMKTLLGLTIGTNVQAYDADLTTYAGITPSANVQTLLNAATYAAFRTSLGVVPGTDVQGYDADLTTYAGITPSANVQTLLGSATYLAFRTSLGVLPGTDVQAYNANTTVLGNTTSGSGSAIALGAVASAPTASTITLRDANGNISTVNFLAGYTTTATAAGTTTLTVSSTYKQYFTGTTTQTVQLPVASTLALGHPFDIENQSTGAVTVTSSGGNVVLIVAAGTAAEITCTTISGTSAASWSAGYYGASIASGKKITVNNTMTLAGTDGSTYTFPGASATIARTDAAQTFTGVQTFSSAPVIGSITNTGTLTLPTNTGTLSQRVASATIASTSSATSTTTLFTPAADGFYRISCYLKITTTGTSPVAGPVTITYTDADGSVAQSHVMLLQSVTGSVVTTTVNNSTTTGTVTGSMVVYAKSGVAIQYAIAVSGTFGAGRYMANLLCEAL